ncbi:hypothetical protein FJZ33_13470 [Candidatus Poribacteria bacterium]|nr:hypothetical protein [Candidatus Poribacteria bacterium]
MKTLYINSLDPVISEFSSSDNFNSLNSDVTDIALLHRMATNDNSIKVAFLAHLSLSFWSF